MSRLIESFLETARVEGTLTGESLTKYGASLTCFIRTVGDLTVGRINSDSVLDLKRELLSRSVGASYINGVIHAIKALLRYCRKHLSLEVDELRDVRDLRIPRLAVVYLTPEELEQFIAAIKLQDGSGRGRPSAFCFRTLVQVLADTGMRLGEALTLDVETIDWTRHQARIIGKGGKERLVHFSERAIRWMLNYLELRGVRTGPIFVSSRTGRRLCRYQAERWCRSYARRSGISKHITLHVLRHTFATTLLKNGCPIGHIQGLLGHDRLETTCRYYLGLLSENDLKKAHERYLDR